MGTITRTVEGDIASFISAGKADIQNLKCYFEPIQEGTGDASPSNVKPIVGWNSFNTLLSGKNLWGGKFATDEMLSEYKKIFPNGNDMQYGENDEGKYLSIGNGYHYDTVNMSPSFKSKPNTVYTIILTAKVSDDSLASANLKILYDDDSWDAVTLTENKEYKVIVTRSNKTLKGIYCRFLYKNTLIYYEDMLGIFEGNITINNYEPYRGQTIPITFPNSNTIYGGYVDLITGDIYRTWRIFQIKDYEWTYKPSNTRFQIQLNSDEYSSASTDIIWTQFAICDSYATSTINGYSNKQIATYKNSYIYIRDEDYDGAESFVEAMGDAYIAYELATPILVAKLSPAQLQTLVGRNNIWSNANDKVSVTYNIHETSQIIEAKKKIIRNQPHIVTASGAIANFKTDMKAPIKSAKFYFNPVQEGTGDPSPENVRDINGWTGFDIIHSGKNLFFYDQNKIEIDLTTDTDLTRGVIHTGIISDGKPISISLFEKDSTTVTNQTYNIGYIKANGTIHVVARILAWDTAAITNQTITIPAGLEFVIVDTGNSAWANNRNMSLYDIQIEISNTITLFESYKGTTSTIDWTSNGTVYGGYIDLISGKLVSLYEKKYLKDCTWGRYTANQFYISSSSVHKNKSSTNVFCDMLSISTTNSYPTVNKSLGFYSNGAGYANQFFIKYTDSDNLIDFNAWLQGLDGDPYIVYEAEFPTEYQLTPTQINSLIGTNNIWSTTNGQTEIQYWTH